MRCISLPDRHVAGWQAWLHTHAVDESMLPPRGIGIATAHHGELLQGQIRDANDKLRRCLVSLPCCGFRSVVTFEADDSHELRVNPPHKRKVLAAIRVALEYFAMEDLGGHVAVDSNIGEGKGYGSSTADCVAAVRAIAEAVGHPLAEEELASLVVRAESASDSTMFRHAVLFAQRDGVVLEHYARPVPVFEVLGIDTSPTDIVDTLEYPPAKYSWRDIEQFHTLVAALRRAIRTQDRRLLAQVSTASAVINERFLPRPLFREMLAGAQHAGALGVAAAHSGTVLALLFDPADPDLRHRIERTSGHLESLGITDVIRFRTAPLRVRETPA